jgi:GDP-4-dehydro-6-deoxy-D-mannose reductase
LRAGGINVVSTGRGETLGYCDINDRQSVQNAIGAVGADYVFQCAAATRPTATAAEMYRIHVAGTLNVLGAAADFTPSAVLVFLGSAAEYGVVEDGDLPIREEQPTKPVSLFGASKSAQTQWALAAAAEWRLRVLVARPFNLLGPGLPERYLAAALAKRLLQEGSTTQPLPVANADATRDFVDVRDAVDALVALTEKAAPEPGKPCVYNIATGRETTVMELAHTLCALHGNRCPIHRGAASSRSHISRSCGDALRLRRVTGWQPHLDWRRSLQDLWEHQRNGEVSAPCPAGGEDWTCGTYATHTTHHPEVVPLSRSMGR